MSGLLLGIVLSVCTCWFHSIVTLPPWFVTTQLGTCSYQCFLSSCTTISLHMLNCICALTLTCRFTYCSFASIGHADVIWSIVTSCYYYYYYYNIQPGGTRWRSGLRQCAKSWKVAISIPDDVTGIFHWYNPSGCTMALGLASTSLNPQSLSRPVMGLLYLYTQPVMNVVQFRTLIKNRIMYFLLQQYLSVRYKPVWSAILSIVAQ